MILKVARLGHPVLRQTALPIPENEISSSENQRLIDDMIETMHEQAGVGLAASQVHVLKRLLVLEVKEVHPRYPQAPPIGLQVLINPVLSEKSDAMAEGWEGCLSLPDLRGKVSRHTSLRVRAFDRQGRRLDFKAEDFHARVIQHEGDHLDGKVFIDRMTDFSSLSFLTEFYRFATVEDQEEAEAND